MTSTEPTTTDEEPVETPAAVGNIHDRIPVIIGELARIEKDSYFDAGEWGYPFRSIESIKGHLKPLLAKHGVHYNAAKIKVVDCSDLGPNRHRVVLLVTWALHGRDSSVSVVHVSMGEAIDTSDKAYAKAMTQAEKYMLIQAFAICDGSSEGEGDHERPARSGAAATPNTVTTPQPETVWTVNAMKNAVIRTVEINVRRERPDKPFTREQVVGYVSNRWVGSGMDNVPPSEDEANRLGSIVAAQALRDVDEWAGIDINADITETVDEPADENSDVPEEPETDGPDDDPDQSTPTGLTDDDLPIDPQHADNNEPTADVEPVDDAEGGDESE